MKAPFGADRQRSKVQRPSQALDKTRAPELWGVRILLPHYLPLLCSVDNQGEGRGDRRKTRRSTPEPCCGGCRSKWLASHNRHNAAPHELRHWVVSRCSSVASPDILPFYRAAVTMTVVFPVERDSQRAVLGVAITFTSLAVISCGLRALARRIAHRSLDSSDWCIFAACVSPGCLPAM